MSMTTPNTSVNPEEDRAELLEGAAVCRLDHEEEAIQRLARTINEVARVWTPDNMQRVLAESLDQNRAALAIRGMDKDWSDVVYRRLASQLVEIVERHAPMVESSSLSHEEKADRLIMAVAQLIETQRDTLIGIAPLTDTERQRLVEGRMSSCR
jgi:hypothetical protein